jgi:hypothetical protein
MSFLNTGWTYDNSSGGALSYGEMLEITAGQARIYVKSPEGTVYKVIGTGIGGGIGMSWFPGSISGSVTDMPSSGTDIYGFGSGSLSVSDFKSFMVIYSAAAFWGAGATGSVAFFISLSTWQQIKLAAVAMSPLGILGVLTELTLAFKATCMFAGMELITNAGVEATGTAYWITSADPCN